MLYFEGLRVVQVSRHPYVVLLALDTLDTDTSLREWQHLTLDSSAHAPYSDPNQCTDPVLPALEVCASFAL
jgi:hypothetical protein